MSFSSPSPRNSRSRLIRRCSCISVTPSVPAGTGPRTVTIAGSLIRSRDLPLLDSLRVRRLHPKSVRGRRATGAGHGPASGAGAGRRAPVPPPAGGLLARGTDLQGVDDALDPAHLLGQQLRPHPLLGGFDGTTEVHGRVAADDPEAGEVRVS